VLSNDNQWRWWVWFTGWRKLFRVEDTSFFTLMPMTHAPQTGGAVNRLLFLAPVFRTIITSGIKISGAENKRD